jgi:ABC-type glycerol-3-phosphate transport system permease component
MSETRVTAGDAGEERDNTILYAGVIVVEVIVVVGIWLFQRYFGS